MVSIDLEVLDSLDLDQRSIDEYIRICTVSGNHEAFFRAA